MTPRLGTRSVAEDSAATADWSVRGVFSPDELEEAIQLAAAQAVDSDAGARVPIPQRRLNSKTTGERCCGGPIRRRQAEEKSMDSFRGELDAANRLVLSREYR